MESAALKLLDNLNPSDYSTKYDQVVALVLALYPRLDHQHFVQWLAKSMPESESRKIFRRVLVKTKNPFSYDLNCISGWIILHYSTGPDTPPGCEDITKVPCIYSSSKQDRCAITSMDTVIAADIRVGDEIKISSLPKVWWVVHEVRPHRNSVMAIRMKESAHTTCGVRGREYQEIYPLQLMGCLVRRLMLSTCEVHSPVDCACRPTGSKWCFFQFPKIQPKEAHKRLLQMAEDSSRGSALFHMATGGEQCRRTGRGGEEDHLRKMQRGAFVQTWLDKKKFLLEASKSLDKIHSSLSLCRPHWMAIGKALRAVSMGGRDLFEKWREWASRCESCRYTAAESLSVWTALRPPTNCDMPDIVRAREFLYHRRALLYGQSIDNDYRVDVENDHRVPLRDIYFDPVSRSVIDDAAVVLHHAFLEYWSGCSEVEDREGPSNRRHAIGHGQSRNKSVRVPCAYYSVNTETYHFTVERQDHNRSQLPEPQFEEMGTSTARVYPGDLLCVMDNSYQYPHTKELSSSSGQQWYLIQRIDLLFARLLVQKCHPPPLQWLEPAAADLKSDSTCHWIAISMLWRVMICSKTPAPEGVMHMTSSVIRYHMFVTPQPDPQQAVQILHQYETRAPAILLGACSRHSISSAQGTVNPSDQKAMYVRQQTPSLCLVVLDSSLSSITLAWGRAMDADDFVQRLLDDDGQPMTEVGMVDVCIRLSREYEMSDWVEVYRGRGSGCKVEHLTEGVCYHIRLRVLVVSSDRVSVSTDDQESTLQYCPQGGAVYIKATTASNTCEDRDTY